ncbi:MAG: hypothetical protein ACR2O1_10545 [Boseongicola sp.]
MFGRVTVILVLLLVINFLVYLDPDGGIDVLIPAVLAAGTIDYLRRTLRKWTLDLDRPANLVSLEVNAWNGRDEQLWNLSDIASIEVSTRAPPSSPRAVSSRPVMVLNNGQREPLCPYDIGPGKTNEVVVPIRKFLGQEPGILVNRY